MPSLVGLGKHDPNLGIDPAIVRASRNLRLSAAPQFVMRIECQVAGIPVSLGDLARAGYWPTRDNGITNFRVSWLRIGIGYNRSRAGQASGAIRKTSK